MAGTSAGKNAWVDFKMCKNVLELQNLFRNDGQKIQIGQFLQRKRHYRISGHLRIRQRSDSSNGRSPTQARRPNSGAGCPNGRPNALRAISSTRHSQLNGATPWRDKNGARRASAPSIPEKMIIICNNIYYAFTDIFLRFLFELFLE